MLQILTLLELDVTNASPFDGTMKEIQIYSSTSAALTANVNTRLAEL
jgi:hypothetical protein